MKSVSKIENKVFSKIQIFTNILTQVTYTKTLELLIYLETRRIFKIKNLLIFIIYQLIYVSEPFINKYNIHILII